MLTICVIDVSQYTVYVMEVGVSLANFRYIDVAPDHEIHAIVRSGCIILVGSELEF